MKHVEKVETAAHMTNPLDIQRNECLTLNRKKNIITNVKCIRNLQFEKNISFKRVVYQKKTLPNITLDIKIDNKCHLDKIYWSNSCEQTDYIYNISNRNYTYLRKQYCLPSLKHKIIMCS